MNSKTPRLRYNIIALGLVQAANYVIPLVTLPYLTRVLGIEAYGQVAFAQVLMAYFILFTDFGFAWSATRHIAAHRQDKTHLSRVFINTWTAQWLLLCAAAMAASLIIPFVGNLNEHSRLYAAAFTLVIGSACFPAWLLQGLERLREVAFIQITTRLLGLIPLFFLVKSAEDTVKVMLIQGGSVIAGGLMCVYWIHQKKLVDWHKPSWKQTAQALKDGMPMFGSRLSISLYTTLVPLVLGSVAGSTAVGYFSIADKLRSAAQSMLSPITQALYPRMSHLFSKDPKMAQSLLKRSGMLVCGVAGSASFALWLLSDWLIWLLAGDGYAPAAQVLRWLALLPLVVGMSNLMGVQYMLPKQMNKAFNAILALASIFSLSIVYILINANSANGAAQTLLAVECFVTLSMLLYILKKKFSRK